MRNRHLTFEYYPHHGLVTSCPHPTEALLHLESGLNLTEHSERTCWKKREATSCCSRFHGWWPPELCFEASGRRSSDISTSFTNVAKDCYESRRQVPELPSTNHFNPRPSKITWIEEYILNSCRIPGMIYGACVYTYTKINKYIYIRAEFGRSASCLPGLGLGAG